MLFLKGWRFPPSNLRDGAPPLHEPYRTLQDGPFGVALSKVGYDHAVPCSGRNRFRRSFDYVSAYVSKQFNSATAKSGQAPKSELARIFYHKSELLFGDLLQGDLRQFYHYMLWTIAVILLILWVLGLVSAFTIHGFIHVLLVAAIIIIVLRLVSGGRAV
jgi:hypothetical protein